MLENKYLIENDSVKIIQPTNEALKKTQLLSFSTIPFVAKYGKGKTTCIQFMANQYIDRFKDSEYNLDNFRCLEAPITHYFFLTENINDESLDRKKKIVIKADDSNLG